MLEHVERCRQLWQLLEAFAGDDALAAKAHSQAPASEVNRHVTVVLTCDEFGTEHFHYDAIPDALAAIDLLLPSA